MTKKELIEWNIERYDIDESDSIKFLLENGYGESKALDILQRGRNDFIKTLPKHIDNLLTIKDCYNFVNDGTCFSCEMNKQSGDLLKMF